MLATKQTWNKAITDPHLIPLGQYLAWTERTAGWGWEDSDHLEKTFLEEPWLNWVQVVLVVDPDGATKPFALLTGSKSRPHNKCHFFNITGKESEVMTFLAPLMFMNY